MDNTQQIFPAFRLVAQFADGQRLTFDGLTEQQAQQSMEAAQAQHGDITWFDGVTDQHYENGRYYKLTPQPPEITMIDLTGYNRTPGGGMTYASSRIQAARQRPL